MKRATVWSRLGDAARLVATPLVPSHYLALVAPLMRPGRARVEHVIDEAPGVRTLVLRPGRGWQGHRAGQHVRVGIAIDGRIVSRVYSISSAPERVDGCFTITVKAQGRVSNALAGAACGTFVAVSAPAGTFVWGGAARVLFVTAGSGITPVASMLRSFASQPGGDGWPDVVHVHYTRDERDIVFRDELRAMAATASRYRRMEVASGRRFDAAELARLVPDWRTREAWACGPESLLTAVEAAIAGVHVERFAAVLRAPADAEGGAVQFGGARVVTDGRTPLLHVLEEAGCAPRSGCRMGICHSCDVTLVAGGVRDLRTGARIDEPGTRIQLCVCAAAGDVALDPQE